MKTDLRVTFFRASAAATLALSLLAASTARAQTAPQQPPPSGESFPLGEVHAGLRATAWTVFRGTQPEPIDVEILGVLRSARGPGNDLILAQLHGNKAEYSGVAAGMSGSPVYIGNRLLGAIAFRIGEFSKDAIAGITPIAQMLEVRDVPVETARLVSGGDGEVAADANPLQQGQEGDDSGDGGEPGGDGNLLPMDSPLVMSGFSSDAIRLWKQKTAGVLSPNLIPTSGMVAGGGSGASSANAVISPEEIKKIQPGMAVSAQIVRGDFEIAATCTVTYVDPKQLLACGHPILQAGRISLPMTSAEVLTTLNSASNSFKIVNTGATLGAFTQDRYSAIRGVFGSQARMIPLEIAIRNGQQSRQLKIEVLDQPPLSAQAMMVAVYQSILMSNQGSADMSYHVTGSIEVEGAPTTNVDVWASSGELFPASITAALMAAERFQRLYTSSTRTGVIRKVALQVEPLGRRLQVELENARLIAANSVRAGQTVEVEATVRPWRQPARNVRFSLQLPARLEPGNVRLLISDAGTLDRSLEQLRPYGHTPDFDAAQAQYRRQHPSDQLYATLLMPEAMAAISGQTLSSLPLSMANVLEPMRATQDVNLNGESAQLLASSPAGGILNGFQILYLHVESGGGIN